MRKRLVVTGALAITGILAALPGIANATPTGSGFVLPFSCDNGQDVTLVNPPGHAAFTPGIVLDFGGVFKPVTLKAIETITNADGSVASAMTDQVEQAHGVVQAENPNVSVNCANVSTFSSDQDPDLQPGQTLTVALTITGFFT